MKMNRFKFLLYMWAIIIVWCAFFSPNTILNVCVIAISFVSILVGFCYIQNHMNESELRFFNKLRNII